MKKQFRDEVIPELLLALAPAGDTEADRFRRKKQRERAAIMLHTMAQLSEIK